MLDRIVLVETPLPRLPGGTRNLGLAQATAPIVAFLAADCLATPGWAAYRIAAHDSNLAVASCIRPAPGPDGRVPLAAWAAHLLLHSRRAPEFPEHRALRYGVSYRRDVFDRAGYFLEDRRIGEDTEFNGRLSAPPAWAPGIVTLHRYPTTAAAALGDAFRRGAHLHGWVRAQRTLPTLRALRRVLGTLVNVMSLLAHAPRDRRGILLAATPLALCLIAAYAAGVLSQMGRKGAPAPPPTSLTPR
jgi:hypothetical protein